MPKVSYDFLKNDIKRIQERNKTNPFIKAPSMK